MVGRAQPEAVKKAKIRHTDDATRQSAVNTFHANKELPEENRESERALARRFGVSVDTLCRHVNGGVSMNASKQKLTPAEERVVVDHICQCADRGFPPSHKNIVFHANTIIEAWGGTNTINPESNWADRFLKRHYVALQTHWSRSLSTQRAHSLNPAAVAGWFDLVKKHIVDEGIRKEDIYGMDESGFPLSNHGRERVVGWAGTKVQHKQGGGDKENVTVIVTICADGTALSPTIIMKGQNIQKKWGEDNVSEASFCVSPNRWIDNELAKDWLVKDFDRQTRDKAEGRTRTLALDNHISHLSPEFLHLADEHLIKVLGYPPNCMHALQGLDVVCFAHQKETWKQEVEIFEKRTGRKVGKGDFAGVFGRAFQRAFTPNIIKAAFRDTGIVPFNPNVITEHQMKPAKATSTKAAFPLQQTSPVQAVMAAFHHYQPTSFELDSDTHMEPITGGSGHREPEASGSGSANQPRTPLRHARDPNIDPALYTPSKRMRMMTSALNGTASGSFLVSQAPVTSRSSIAAPVLEGIPLLPSLDWDLIAANRPEQIQHLSAPQLRGRIGELTSSLGLGRQHLIAREGIIEAAHAQMVIQNIFVRQQSEALHAKETKKSSKLAKVQGVEGKGRDLTVPEYIESLEKEQQEKLDEGAAKDVRAQKRERKRTAKVELEERWKGIKADHESAVQRWEKICAELLTGGTRKKDLPKKPKQAKKPKLPVDDESEDDSGSSSSSDSN